MDLNLHDIIQIYKDTLCLYNGVPVKVMEVNPDKRIRIFNLISQKVHWVLFDYNKFSAPRGRLGYVNIMGNALYVKRQPMRRFSNGLTRNNMIILANEGVGGENLQYAMEILKERTSPAFIAPMFGEYPSRAEALNFLKEEGVCSVAFDRQFSVSKSGREIFLHYKSKIVAEMVDDNFVFSNKFSYLENLMESGYGKTVE